jgi:hypothetical protein
MEIIIWLGAIEVELDLVNSLEKQEVLKFVFGMGWELTQNHEARWEIINFGPTGKVDTGIMETI